MGRRFVFPPATLMVLPRSLRSSVMRRLVVAALLTGALAPALLHAQRATGVVGAYVPPRDWPQEARRFDLLHQKIEIRFDVPTRTLYGTVTTRIAMTSATDTVRL